ncbi:MAG: glycerol-3-phosphate acyltransferase [Ruminococcaceae bacterium]|nr:glycerol-3-phosphate acyltransferase [Oscillospiraceae bacterium]
MIILCLSYAAVVLIAYLFGCSNLAYFISRSRGVNLRECGSGNLGTSNALIAFGWSSAVLVGIHDIGKAVIAVLLAQAVFPELTFIGAVAGVSCVLGHVFPFYLRFRGGKGFAAYLGMTLALNWKFALIMVLVVVVVSLASDYIVVGTVTTMITVPIYMGIAAKSFVLAGVLCIASFVILYQHRDNYVRMRNGTEIGIRHAAIGTEKKNG